MPTTDGYPTEKELRRIKEWPYTDLLGWFTCIKSCWWAADWGWTEGVVKEAGRVSRRYQISTGGWSGNESIINAMHANHWAWFFSWLSSRRGGHFSFEHPAEYASLVRAGIADPAVKEGK